ncbi:MAG: acyl-CoA dehydrogenase family protein, partial [Gammaproteobacteria bacterium]
VEPYLATILLAGRSLAAGGRTQLVSDIIEGETHGALAALERQSRQNFYDVATQAKSTDGGYVLNGSKALVLNGPAADVLIVTARTSGTNLDREGVSLFELPADSNGVTRQSIRLMDGSRAANLVLDHVEVGADRLIGDVDRAFEVLDPVIAEATIGVCAEAVGIIDALCAKTIEYARTRNQFGVAIGSFQALQHRMVDMLMAKEQARSMLYRGVCEYQQADPAYRETLAAMKAVVGRHGRHVGEEAIQLHGGMGMTDELDIGHYVKRLMVLNQLFGDIDASLDTFAGTRYAA